MEEGSLKNDKAAKGIALQEHVNCSWQRRQVLSSQFSAGVLLLAAGLQM